MAIKFLSSWPIICKFTMHKSVIFPSKAANFTVLKLISKQACSFIEYYRDQVPICLSVRRYHRRENTCICENTTKNIAAVSSTF